MSERQQHTQRAEGILPTVRSAHSVSASVSASLWPESVFIFTRRAVCCAGLSDV